MTENNWIYSDDRMHLRSQCLFMLLEKFGSALTENGEPLHSTESMYGCAHDWVSQGNPSPDGILDYYKNHYRVKSS